MIVISDYILELGGFVHFEENRPANYVFGSTVVTTTDFLRGVRVGKSCSLGKACRVAIDLIFYSWSRLRCEDVIIACARTPTDAYRDELKVLSLIARSAIAKVRFKVPVCLSRELRKLGLQYEIIERYNA